MNSFSHFIIGSFISRYIKYNYGVKVRSFRFIYWNIMTDFRKPYRTPPHTVDYWDSRLKDEIFALMLPKQAVSPIEPETSKSLGVICHFYADFFCFPHTDAYEGTYWQHIKYELALYKFMRRSFSKLSNTDFACELNNGWGAYEIVNRLKMLQREYLSEPASFDNDIIYTLRACIGAAVKITCTANSSEKMQRPEMNAPGAYAAQIQD